MCGLAQHGMHKTTQYNSFSQSSTFTSNIAESPLSELLEDLEKKNRFAAVVDIILADNLDPKSPIEDIILRAMVVLLAIATQAVCELVVNMVVPYLVIPDETSLHGKVGFSFGRLTLVGMMDSWFFVPESKGKALDEIDRPFAPKAPLRKMSHSKD